MRDPRPSAWLLRSRGAQSRCARNHSERLSSLVVPPHHRSHTDPPVNLLPSTLANVEASQGVGPGQEAGRVRVGHYIPQLWVEPGRGANVSGHIQLAMRSAAIASETHEVEVITHEPPAGFVPPALLDPDLTVHFVPDAMRRGGELGHHVSEASRLRMLGPARQALALRRLARTCRLDLLHFHGRAGTVRLAAIVASLRPGCPVVVTAIDAPQSRVGERRILRRLAAIATTTDTVSAEFATIGIDASVLPHGPCRDLLAERTAPSPTKPEISVVFWREANDQNGGDICLAAFEALAPRHPSVMFRLVLRPFWRETVGVDALADRHPNISVHRFPYKDGLGLADLVCSASIVALPFRSLTMNPQMAVLESAAAGIPVVTTDIGSNREVVEHGRSGLLVPPDDAPALIVAIESLLAEPTERTRMGAAAIDHTLHRWTWDGHRESLEVLYGSTRPPAPQTRFIASGTPSSPKVMPDRQGRQHRIREQPAV